MIALAVCCFVEQLTQSQCTRPALQSVLPNVSRIVFTGDSIARGLMMNNMAARFSSRFVGWLQQDNGRPITEINKGETGWALVDRHNFYMERGVTIGNWILTLEPHAVVAEWGANDHFWGYQEDEYLACYNLLLHDLRAARPDMPIAVMTTVPDWRFPNKHLSADQKRRAWPNGLDPIWSERAHAGLQELAVQYRCHVAHVHKAYDHKSSLQKDLVHPHEHGHLVMAAELYEAFARPPLGPDNIHFITDIHNQTVQFLGFSIQAHGVPVHQQHWVEFHNITVNGFFLITPVNLTISTPSLLVAGTQVTVEAYYPDLSTKVILHTIVSSNKSVTFGIDVTSDAPSKHTAAAIQIVINGTFTSRTLEAPDHSFASIRTVGNRVAFNFSSIVTKRPRRPRPGGKRKTSPGPAVVTKLAMATDDAGADAEDTAEQGPGDANQTLTVDAGDPAFGQSSYMIVLAIGLFAFNVFMLLRWRDRGKRLSRDRITT